MRLHCRWFAILSLALTACAAGDATGGRLADAGAKPADFDGAAAVLIVHYQRPGGDFDGWNLWVWADGRDGAAESFDAADRFGRYVVVRLDQRAERIGFLLRRGEWQEKDVEQDRFVDLGPSGVAEVWLYRGDPEIHTDPPPDPAADEDDGGDDGHLFRFEAPADAETVALAGTFNGWSRTAHPMTARGGGGWELRVRLAEGVHQYKFVVDGETWMIDPASDTELERPDGHGGMNSALLIGIDGRKLPPAAPDAINTAVVRHDPASHAARMVNSESLLMLSISAQAADVERAVVHVQQADRWIEHPLASEGGVLGFERFADRLVTEPGDLRYFFELTDGAATVYLSSAGVSGSDAEARAAAFSVEMVDAALTPDWAKEAVWYQVFPERFRNGDPDNDPGDKWFEHKVRWQSDWWAAAPGEEPGAENFYSGAGNVWRRRYGGDIRGVRESLGYLRDLGVTAIYFNPVFEADSMHKYDATDYRHIDDNFGVGGDLPMAGETGDPETWRWSDSDRVFLDFIEEAHRRGFKVVVDGVFNHVGRPHPYFQDVLEKGRDSRYADWFEITDWGEGGEPGTEGGIQWKGWDAENGHLPAWKKDAERGLAAGPRQHIFAITRRWMAPDGDPTRGIDGWRLDVPGDIPHPFWIEWRRLVKEINPDAYISGEIWGWAHAWLRGDQFDAVMNYPFAEAAQDFLVDRETAITPTEFARRLEKIVYGYPMQVSLAQMNLFDSHDTDRIASMFVNPDRPYDGENRIQDNGTDYDRRKPTDEEYRRMLQAVALQMTYLGAPMIYYGSEAGMWSPDDPSNRQPMVWRDHEPYDDPAVYFHRDVFDRYRKLIAIRRTLPALRLGRFETVLADDEHDTVAFAREREGRAVTVVLNRARDARTVRVPLKADGPVIDLLAPGALQVVSADDDAGRPTVRTTGRPARIQPEDGHVSVDLGSYGVAILVSPDLVPR